MHPKRSTTLRGMAGPRSAHLILLEHRQFSHDTAIACRQSFTKHALAAMLSLSLSANPAFAAAPAAAQGASSTEASTSTDSSDNTTPIYFGNGCFWGRQKDFVDVEKALGRDGGKISAITGYAGGAKGAGTTCSHVLAVFWLHTTTGSC